MSRIGFDLSAIRGIVFDMDGVLSASTVAVREDGTLQRHSNVKDGYAINYAVRRGLALAVISGAKDESMLPAYRSLGLEDIYFHCADKISTLEEWMRKRGLSENEVIFVGDDIPDIPPMQRVALGACPADAAEEVKMIAGYISPVNGGAGVARDIISQVMKARGEWLLPDAFSW